MAHPDRPEKSATPVSLEEQIASETSLLLKRAGLYYAQFPDVDFDPTDPRTLNTLLLPFEMPGRRPTLRTQLENLRFINTMYRTHLENISIPDPESTQENSTSVNALKKI